MKGSKDSKKEIIARKYDEIERELQSINQLLRESGVPEEELLSREQFLPLIEDELFFHAFYWYFFPAEISHLTLK